MYDGRLNLGIGRRHGKVEGDGFACSTVLVCIICQASQEDGVGIRVGKLSPFLHLHRHELPLGLGRMPPTYIVVHLESFQDHRLLHEMVDDVVPTDDEVH